MSDPVETGPIVWEVALDKDGDLELYVECPTFLGWDEVQSFWMNRDAAAATVRHLVKTFGLRPEEVLTPSDPAP